MGIAEALIALLDAAIHGKDSPFDASVFDERQWRSILGGAAVQNIHTLIYDVLPEGIPEDVMEIWSGQVHQVEKVNRRIAAVAAAQEKVWNDRGLNYAMMKGLSVASLYPHPEHRGCGDIDWYFTDEKSWNEALELAEKNVPGGVNRDSDGDVNYTWNGVVIEHHRDWTHLSSRKNRLMAGNAHIECGRFGPEDVLLMLNAHILHHLSTSGIGLKQLADLAVAYEKYAGSYDEEHYSCRLKKLGLERWTALLHSVLVEITGAPSEVLPVTPIHYAPDVETVIRLVFCDGNFGMHRGKHRFGNMGMRINVLMKYCPREVVSRYWHLAAGRIGK